MASSPGFGSHPQYYNFALFTLAFAMASMRNILASTTDPLVGSFFNRHAVVVRINSPLRLLVDIRFQFYFTPLTGVLFTFPSRYLFTIGLERYVALPVSTGKFLQAIHVLKYSGTLEKVV